MNIRNILSYSINIFDNSVRRAEEQQILNRLKEARIRERILSAAMAHGADVQDDLEHTKSQIIDLTNRIPHGDNWSFYAYCIFGIPFIICFVYSWRAVQPLVIEFSRIDFRTVPDHWIFKVWRAGCFITSSIWFAVLAVLLLLLLWYVQKRLQRHWARRLIIIIAVLGVITAFIFSLVAFTLMTPLTIMSAA